MTAGWRGAVWTYPLDPKCPVVLAVVRHGYNVSGDVHRAGCRRCHAYGVANAILTRGAKARE